MGAAGDCVPVGPVGVLRGADAVLVGGDAGVAGIVPVEADAAVARQRGQAARRRRKRWKRRCGGLAGRAGAGRVQGAYLDLVEQAVGEAAQERKGGGRVGAAGDRVPVGPVGVLRGPDAVLVGGDGGVAGIVPVEADAAVARQRGEAARRGRRRRERRCGDLAGRPGAGGVQGAYLDSVGNSGGQAGQRVAGSRVGTAGGDLPVPPIGVAGSAQAHFVGDDAGVVRVVPVEVDGAVARLRRQTGRRRRCQRQRRCGGFARRADAGRAARAHLDPVGHAGGQTGQRVAGSRAGTAGDDLPAPPVGVAGSAQAHFVGDDAGVVRVVPVEVDGAVARSRRQAARRRRRPGFRRRFRLLGRRFRRRGRRACRRRNAARGAKCHHCCHCHCHY